MLAACGSACGADPWADGVVSYTSGAIAAPNLNNPLTTLGSPERYTGEGAFPGAVTAFNPAYSPDEIVSIGAGGSLTLRFDEPVTDDAGNPFGIDLLIFGNAGYNSDLGFGVTSGALFGDSTQGLVEVSADGLAWFTIAGAQPDSAYPTLGYLDGTDPFGGNPGVVLSDFTRPVNPAFSAEGLNYAQIIAAYDGSGGGVGIDLMGTGVSSISFVRISYLGTSGDLQIEAMADVAAVPAPSALLLGGAGVLAARRRRA